MTPAKAETAFAEAETAPAEAVTTPAKLQKLQQVDTCPKNDITYSLIPNLSSLLSYPKK